MPYVMAQYNFFEMQLLNRVASRRAEAAGHRWATRACPPAQDGQCFNEPSWRPLPFVLVVQILY